MRRSNLLICLPFLAFGAASASAEKPASTFEDTMIVVDSPEDVVNVIGLPPPQRTKGSSTRGKGSSDADEARRNSEEAREEVRDTQIEDDKSLLEVIIETVGDTANEIAQ